MSTATAKIEVWRKHKEEYIKYGFAWVQKGYPLVFVLCIKMQAKRCLMSFQPNQRLNKATSHKLASGLST